MSSCADVITGTSVSERMWECEAVEDVVERVRVCLLWPYWTLALLGCLAAKFFPPIRSATSYGSVRLTLPSPSPSSLSSSSFISFLLSPFAIIFQLHVSSKMSFFLFYFVSFLLNAGTLSLWLLSHGPQAMLRSFSPSSSPSLLFPFCLSLHSLRRLMEVLFLHRFSPQSRVPLVTCLSGVSFYIFLYLSWFFDPNILCSFPFLHPILQFLSSFLPTAPVSSLYLHDFKTFPSYVLTLLGILLFFVSSFVQYHCHSELAQLREQSSTKSEKIGRQRKVSLNALQSKGDNGPPLISYPSHCHFFRLVICPHYCSEILFISPFSSFHSLLHLRLT